MSELSSNYHGDIEFFAVEVDQNLHFQCDRVERVMASYRWPARVKREQVIMSTGGEIFIFPLESRIPFFGSPEKKANDPDLLGELGIAMASKALIVKTGDSWNLVLSKETELPNTY